MQVVWDNIAGGMDQISTNTITTVFVKICVLPVFLPFLLLFTRTGLRIGTYIFWRTELCLLRSLEVGVLVVDVDGNALTFRE